MSAIALGPSTFSSTPTSSSGSAGDQRDHLREQRGHAAHERLELDILAGRLLLDGLDPRLQIRLGLDDLEQPKTSDALRDESQRCRRAA